MKRSDKCTLTSVAAGLATGTVLVVHWGFKIWVAAIIGVLVAATILSELLKNTAHRTIVDKEADAPREDK